MVKHCSDKKKSMLKPIQGCPISRYNNNPRVQHKSMCRNLWPIKNLMLSHNPKYDFMDFFKVIEK